MPNKWIEHVKQYAAYHNIPYNQAIKEAKSSYNKGSVMIGSGGGASAEYRQRPIIDDPQIINLFHEYMAERSDMTTIQKAKFRIIIRNVVHGVNTDEEMTQYNKKLGEFLDRAHGGEFASIVRDT